MERKIIAAEAAPKAIGPYAQANEVGGFIFTSGQLPIDPAEGVITAGGIEEQTRQVFANLKAILEEAGSGLDKIVKTTCFMKDLNDFSSMNRVYAEYFPEGIYPSRSAYQVAALPMDALIEVEAVAVK